MNRPLFRRARMGVARTWQNMRLFSSMSVLDNLLVAPRFLPLAKASFRSSSRRARCAAMRTRCGARTRHPDTDELAALASRPVTDLPFGQQKLIGLARALMNDGDCLLLDEPMAGVEGEAYETMKTVVRQEADGGRRRLRGRAQCLLRQGPLHHRDLHGERSDHRTRRRGRPACELHAGRTLFPGH